MRAEAWRRKFAMDDLYAGARPGRGHRAVARWAAAGLRARGRHPEHRRAARGRGRPGDEIVELHGNGSYRALPRLRRPPRARPHPRPLRAPTARSRNAPAAASSSRPASPSASRWTPATCGAPSRRRSAATCSSCSARRCWCARRRASPNSRGATARASRSSTASRRRSTPRPTSSSAPTSATCSTRSDPSRSPATGAAARRRVAGNTHFIILRSRASFDFDGIPPVLRSADGGSGRFARAATRPSMPRAGRRRFWTG